MSEIEPEEVDWEGPLASLVMDEWDKAESFNSDLDDMYEDLYLMLRGERPDRQYDWQSNIVINKVFQIVWTAIPYLIQKMFGADPMMGIISYDKSGAWQREQILQFWATMQPGNPNHTPYVEVMVMWTLRGLLNGLAILKKSWHQKLKRKTVTQQIAVPMKVGSQGEDLEVEPQNISKTVSIPIEDWPHNEVVSVKDIKCDWMLKPGESIRKGRFITHRSTQDLDFLYESGLYHNLDQLDPNIASTSDGSEDHSTLTGKDDQETPPTSDVYADIEIYERQGILHVYKKKEGGFFVPCFDKEDAYDNKEVVVKQMVTTIARRQGEKGNVVIRHEVNPYEEKGYIDMQIYLDPERWQSMGMVEPVKDLTTALNDNMNASFDEIWQNLMPPVIIDNTRLWDYDTMVYAPQQRWVQSGDPRSSVYFKDPSNITGDAWQKHALLNAEIDLTSSVTPSMQGVGKEKTATTNILNAQMSTGKMDFILKMIEVTALIPSAQMDVRFAKKFAHPMTFQRILGQPFQYSEWEEIYNYVPAASSVKLEQQKQQEIQEDMQIMQVLGSVPNPNTAKVMNIFLANILRNRGMPKEAQLYDEDYFEPKTEGGQMERINQQLGTGTPSNDTGIPMSPTEQGVRRSTYAPEGLLQ